MNGYRILIGQRGAPRLDFPCMSPDSCTAVAQHADLAEPGERVEALRIAADVSNATHKAARYHAMNDRRAMELQLRRADVQDVIAGRV